MLETVLIIFITAIATILGLASRKPDMFRVTRSTTINTTPAAIYPHIASTRAWQPWSPWVKMDPAASVNFSGPETGVGSSHSWSGKKIGEGTMTVIEARPNEYLNFRLDFRKPMKATNYSDFTLASLTPTSTLVVWSFNGKSNFMGKIMSTIMDCDSMMGKTFEDGLRDLKEVAEGKTFGQATATKPTATQQNTAA